MICLATECGRAPMDIVVWLRSLGLGKYEAIFRDNDIDEAVLPSLTHENLKELGVASFGHRVKLLDAIAALRPSSDLNTATSAPSPEDRAERRQVTVMFSDLVGSTALSARMDPEDLREVISAYQKCVAETVQRFGGFVAKYMGDGVLVYFGYPQAHEDDAERAVRARLELVAGHWWSEDPRATTDARRHRNGPCGRRRPSRLRRFSGAGDRRRDAEPCGAASERCRAEQRCHCGEHSEARRQSV
jgi:SAM domain (Sterile alpha motif)/Adenylate and Guanylate cyclase catalytic domain